MAFTDPRGVTHDKGEGLQLMEFTPTLQIPKGDLYVFIGLTGVLCRGEGGVKITLNAPDNVQESLNRLSATERMAICKRYVDILTEFFACPEGP
jgi:hypothetical protein